MTHALDRHRTRAICAAGLLFAATPSVSAAPSEEPSNVTSSADASPMLSADEAEPDFEGSAGDALEHRIGLEGQWLLGFEDVLRAQYVTASTEFEAPARVQAHRAKSVSFEMNYPTLTLDHFLVERLSLGVAAAYDVSTSQYTVTSTGGGPDSRTVSTAAFHHASIGPRIGYALPLSDGLDLWGRLGVVGRLDRTLRGFEPEIGPSAIAETDLRDYTLSATASVLFAYSPTDYVTLVGGPGLTQDVVRVRRSVIDGRDTKTFERPPVPSLSAGVSIRL